MDLIVNGKEFEAETNVTVEDLVARLFPSSSREGIAVAVNEAVVPRGSWSQRRLQAGDRVEVIRAVQGG